MGRADGKSVRCLHDRGPQPTLDRGCESGGAEWWEAGRVTKRASIARSALEVSAVCSLWPTAKRFSPPTPSTHYLGGRMAYQYVREPLTDDEADRLANACETPTEKLVVWTLLDTGLRISEPCNLTAKDVLWQQRQLRF